VRIINQAAHNTTRPIHFKYKHLKETGNIRSEIFDKVS